MGMEKEAKTALLIGRFQPFHKGHEKAVDHLLKRYGRVVLGIGSSQYKRTEENPFSGSERVAMIKTVARAHPKWQGRVRTALLPDFPKSDKKWAEAVRSRFSPKKIVVGSANAWVRRLCKKAGFEINPAPLFRRNEWQGTQIRARVRTGKRWAHLVSPVLVGWMKKRGVGIILKTGAKSAAKKKKK